MDFNQIIGLLPLASLGVNFILLAINLRMMHRSLRLNATLDAMAVEWFQISRFIAWPAARHGVRVRERLQP